MQHHGVPTRLLDFSESPYVALYFALESYSAQSGKDFALYALDYKSILQFSIDHIKTRDAKFSETPDSVFQQQDEIFESVVDRFAYDIAWIAEPNVLNARLDRQAGSFLLSGNRELRIEETLSLKIYRNSNIMKIIIDKDLYTCIFSLLRKMNLTSKALYGDIDGLARSLRMEMMAYSFSV